VSYQVFVQKFENGDSGIIPFDELNLILSKYGKIEEGHFGLEFISSVGDICDDAPLSGTSKETITGISFNRPTAFDPLPEIIYDLLSIKNTCFFGPDLEYLHSRSDMTAHLPESLLESVEEGLKVITSPKSSWPLK